MFKLIDVRSQLPIIKLEKLNVVRSHDQVVISHRFWPWPTLTSSTSCMRWDVQVVWAVPTHGLLMAYSLPPTQGLLIAHLWPTTHGLLMAHSWLTHGPTHGLLILMGYSWPTHCLLMAYSWHNNSIATVPVFDMKTMILSILHDTTLSCASCYMILHWAVQAVRAVWAVVAYSWPTHVLSKWLQMVCPSSVLSKLLRMVCLSLVLFKRLRIACQSSVLLKSDEVKW